MINSVDQLKSVPRTAPPTADAVLSLADAAIHPLSAPSPVKEASASESEVVKGHHAILRQVLGSDFDRLHPKLQERYGFSSADPVYSVGRGSMDRVWHGWSLFTPFLHIGSQRNIMSPEHGSDVPFRVECWAYKDTFGRETLSINRTYSMKRERRFDEYIVAVPGAPGLIIYVGSHQHLAVELSASVSERGGLQFETGRQRLLTRGPSLRFPLLFSAQAKVHEWFDDKSSRFHIDAKVRNKLLGDVFCSVGGYEGELQQVPEAGVPQRIRPVCEDPRWP